MEKTILATNPIWDKKVKVEESSYFWKGDTVVNLRSHKLSGRPTVAEFFSGCGGTSMGFTMAGYDVIFGADIHKPSLDSFAYNHRKANTLLGDLKKISAEETRRIINHRVNVAIAGVPCQGFSLNNRKRWEQDERNYLFSEYMRFVESLNPDVVILENVPGMRNASNGAFVKAIKEKIAELGYPFVEANMVNAADYGVPQTRFRLIFVGSKKRPFEWPKETHGPKGKRPYLTVWDAIGDLPRIRSGESANRYDRSPQTAYQKLMRRRAKNELHNHVAPRHPDGTVKNIEKTRPGMPMYARFSQRIRLHWKEPSPTQVSGGIRPQFQFGHPSIPRGLTVRERCRIQSFPDDFIVFGGTVQGRVQTGNAVPPLLAKALAKQALKIL